MILDEELQIISKVKKHLKDKVIQQQEEIESYRVEIEKKVNQQVKEFVKINKLIWSLWI